jgi:hypothetical protein
VLLLADRFAVRTDLPAVLADFNFDLLVAIWLSCWVNGQHHVLPLTRPRSLGGAGEQEK